MKSDINEIELIGGLGDLNDLQNEQVNKFITSSKSYYNIQKTKDKLLSPIDKVIDKNQSPTKIKDFTN